MSNARKKAKQEKKARARKDKAKAVQARKIVAKKEAGADSSKDSVPGFRSDSRQSSAKPSARSEGKIRRTQGK
ncbi:MAG: hypothetical protein DRQ55_06445 [Planctomycetota bacterium]|nr:MAG: hypothetical protein DRQ55_06445 [Planctomycetota bacterium]